LILFFSSTVFRRFIKLESVAEAAYNKNYNDYDYPPVAAIIIAASIIETTHILIPPFCYYIMSEQKGVLQECTA